ncbi:hypothetical protein SAMN02745121_09137, partial [Nannocystis exedens]
SLDAGLAGVFCRRFSPLISAAGFTRIYAVVNNYEGCPENSQIRDKFETTF